MEFTCRSNRSNRRLEEALIRCLVNRTRYTPRKQNSNLKSSAFGAVRLVLEGLLGQLKSLRSPRVKPSGSTLWFSLRSSVTHSKLGGCSRIRQVLGGCQSRRRPEKPSPEGNRCNLRHVAPKTLQKALYVVCSESGGPLQVVCRGLSRFPVPGSAPAHLRLANLWLTPSYSWFRRGADKHMAQWKFFRAISSTGLNPSPLRKSGSTQGTDCNVLPRRSNPRTGHHGRSRLWSG